MEEILSLLNPWWSGNKFETGIERKSYLDRLERSLAHKRAVLVVGSRRVGKTTLLRQLIAQLLISVDPRHILYALMDHPQLTPHSLTDVVRAMRARFALDRTTRLYLFFDEVQSLSRWEQDAKALIDTENVKLFLSGSASTHLLMRGTYLTGRIENLTVHPLDFREFITFRKMSISDIESYKYQAVLQDYMRLGGYPEYVLEQDPAYVSDLVNSVLYKDIASLYQLRNPDLLKNLLLLIADRAGSHTTYARLARILSLTNDTIKEYLHHLMHTFLIDELPRFTASRSHRIYGPKKFYLNDNGLLSNLTGKLNKGAAFEQTLFHYLQSRYPAVGFHYEQQKEVDFIAETESGKVLWEAKYEGGEDERDTVSYAGLARSLHAKRAILVTMEHESKVETSGMTVERIPLWRLLLSPDTLL